MMRFSLSTYGDVSQPEIRPLSPCYSVWRFDALILCPLGPTRDVSRYEGHHDKRSTRRHGKTQNRFGNGLLRESREAGCEDRRRCGAASAHCQDSPGKHRPQGRGPGRVRSGRRGACPVAEWRGCADRIHARTRVDAGLHRGSCSRRPRCLEKRGRPIRRRSQAGQSLHPCRPDHRSLRASRPFWQRGFLRCQPGVGISSQP